MTMVQAGAALEPITRGPITRSQIARFAAATGDFNPIHTDEAFAQKIGFPSVIAHGPLTLARGLDAIVAQVGAGAVKAVEARLKAPYLPGESLTVVPVDGGFELRDGSGTVLMTALLTLDD